MEITGEKKTIETTVIYSAQAQSLIGRFKDFNKEEFEREYFKSITVGDRAILEYIYSKDKK